jgi:uncharacterized protein (UPF0248 family)
VTITRITTDWRAYSAANVLLSTFETADLASAWVQTVGATLPGHRIVRIRTRVTEETVWEDAAERAA